MFLFWNRISWFACYNRYDFSFSRFMKAFGVSFDREPSFGFGIWYIVLTLCRCSLNFFVYFCILLGFLVSLLHKSLMNLLTILKFFKEYMKSNKFNNLNSPNKPNEPNGPNGPNGPKWWEIVYKTIISLFEKLRNLIKENYVIFGAIVSLNRIVATIKSIYYCKDVYYSLDYQLGVQSFVDNYYYTLLETDVPAQCLNLSIDFYYLFNFYSLDSYILYAGILEIIKYYIDKEKMIMGPREHSKPLWPKSSSNALYMDNSPQQWNDDVKNIMRMDTKAMDAHRDYIYNYLSPNKADYMHARFVEYHNPYWRLRGVSILRIDNYIRNIMQEEWKDVTSELRDHLAKEAIEIIFRMNKGDSLVDNLTTLQRTALGYQYLQDPEIRERLTPTAKSELQKGRSPVAYLSMGSAIITRPKLEQIYASLSNK